MRTIAETGGIMSVIYGLIPGMIILGLVSVLIFFWAVKNGQYDDMEGPAHRILDDDDLTSDDSENHLPSDQPDNHPHKHPPS